MKLISGRGLAIFVLASWGSFVQAENDSWADKSPHKQGFVTVNGITLEYLDWGGSGEALLFLAGLGSTGHIFDDMAPNFTNRFRVLALTRRGYGKSDKPQSGYEFGILVNDIRQFVDALKINRVTLVGHSLGGLEGAAFAQAFPEQVHKVVYLDSAYPYAEPGVKETLAHIGSLAPRRSAKDITNLAALRTWFQKNRPGWNNACEADLRNTRRAEPGGYSGGSSTPDFVEAASMKGFTQPLPDYTKIQAPALAFFADHQMDKLFAQLPESKRIKAEAPTKAAKEWFSSYIKRFAAEVKNARVVELPDTDHFCFIQRQDDVVRHMDGFLKEIRP
jgi:pimeloyl-ACP methyl ester carboxylesterase